jgi:hypothetical protein
MICAVFALFSLSFFALQLLCLLPYKAKSTATLWRQLIVRKREQLPETSSASTLQALHQNIGGVPWKHGNRL